MDDAIRKALKKKKELLIEVDRLEKFIVTYEELTGEKIPRDEMIARASLGDNPIQNEEQTQKEAPKKRRNNIKKLLDVSERLIREAGRPLTRTELAEGMERLNVVVHATDKPKYLGTLLWRNTDRFVSSDGDGYLTVKMAHQRSIDSLIGSPTAQDADEHTSVPSRDIDDEIPF